MALAVSKGEVEIWDAAAGRIVYRLPTGFHPFIELTPDGKILVVQDSNTVNTGKEPQQGRIRLFDTTAGNESHRIVESRDG